MNNVVPITKNKSRRASAVISRSGSEIASRISGPDTAPADDMTSRLLLVAVENASSDYLVTKLRIEQKRARMERELAQEIEDNEAALEAVAYSAFVRGVEENEIYALDEFAGAALENAIRKMANHA
jgi:hypothetical protein